MQLLIKSGGDDRRKLYPEITAEDETAGEIRRLSQDAGDIRYSGTVYILKDVNICVYRYSSSTLFTLQFFNTESKMLDKSKLLMYNISIK